MITPSGDIYQDLIDQYCVCAGKRREGEEYLVAVFLIRITHRDSYALPRTDALPHLLYYIHLDLHPHSQTQIHKQCLNTSEW